MSSIPGDCPYDSPHQVPGTRYTFRLSAVFFLYPSPTGRFYVLQVVSVGNGREGESGHVTPNDAVKPGDLVFVKDPYGIGESVLCYQYFKAVVSRVYTKDVPGYFPGYDQHN